MSGREQSRVRKSYNDLMLEYWKRKHENTRENRYETARPDSVVAVSIRFHHHHAEWIAAFTKGRAEYFTGSGDVEELVPATAPARTSGGRVTFKPGARSAWHTHPLGQILIVTAGTGWIQEWGGRKEEIREGDVVRIPPGQKHWHGATATTGMTHIAIQEQLNGKAVEWMEKVSDEQYRK